eukprot:UN26069
MKCGSFVYVQRMLLTFVTCFVLFDLCYLILLVCCLCTRHNSKSKKSTMRNVCKKIIPLATTPNRTRSETHGRTISSVDSIYLFKRKRTTKPNQCPSAVTRLKTIITTSYIFLEKTSTLQ